jgi:hypothetical protein
MRPFPPRQEEERVPNKVDDEKLYDRAVRRLRGAMAALWDSGASWEAIEDEIEEAQREAGIDARAAEERRK